MPRQFMGRYASGNANEILQRIRRVVRSLGAGAQVPVVFFEKKARGKFYVFLGVEMEQGAGVPEVAGLVFERAGIRSRQEGPFQWAEIRSMLDPREFDTEGTERVPYQPRWCHDAGDLFDDVELTQSSDSGHVNPEAYRRLLAWLSAAGQGRWETFVRVCQILNLAGNSMQARQVFRRLSLLGHVEPAAEGAAWSVAPATLVQSASDSSMAFWCGQWTPWLQGQLPQEWRLPDEQRPGVEGPPRVLAHLAGVGEGQSVALGTVALRVGGVVSQRLAELLPDLQGWQQTLQPIPGMTTPQRAERWHENDYQPDVPFFRSGEGWHGDTGLYRVTRGSEKFPITLTFFFDAERQQLLRGDWYGLRFLALRRTGISCLASWRQEEGTECLLIPTRQRWPLVYERALVLASGLLPEARYSSGGSFLCYPGISASLAATLTDKLGVELLRGV